MQSMRPDLLNWPILFRKYVHTKRKKARRFQQGLKTWIRSRVAVFELNTYFLVVQKAIIIEYESDHGQKEQEGGKRKFEQQRASQNQGSIQGRFEKRHEFEDN